MCGRRPEPGVSREASNGRQSDRSVRGSPGARRTSMPLDLFVARRAPRLLVVVYGAGHSAPGGYEEFPARTCRLSLQPTFTACFLIWMNHVEESWYLYIFPLNLPEKLRCRTGSFESRDVEFPFVLSGEIDSVRKSRDIYFPTKPSGEIEFVNTSRDVRSRDGQCSRYM